MSKVPRWLSLVLLPLAGSFDSASYYTARAVLYQHLREGVSLEQVSFAMTGAAFASLFGTIVSGALAAATGPWAMAIGGAGLLMLATVMLGGLPPEVGAIAAIFLGFAHGMTRTALLGAAARAFPDFRTEGLRNAACFGVYGAANLAALWAAPAASTLAREVSPRSVFLSSTALGGLPLLVIVIALGVVVWMKRREEDELTAPPKRTGNLHLIVAAGVLLLAGASCGCSGRAATSSSTSSPGRRAAATRSTRR
ncbi:MAG: hypothetical protein H6719_30905 [Sandaracinaceae bacterium]|nr:hypothetical protein [Sandaracinaceae bacterium]